MKKDDKPEIRAILEGISAQLADLTARVARLESNDGTGALCAGQTGQAVSEPQGAPPPPEAIPEEIVLAISAAIAAFFGERVHIRQIRLVTSPAWAQQGRVWIQASHRLH